MFFAYLQVRGIIKVAVFLQFYGNLNFNKFEIQSMNCNHHFLIIKCEIQKAIRLLFKKVLQGLIFP